MTGQEISQQAAPVGQLLGSKAVLNRFEGVLGDKAKATAFLSTVLTLVNASPQLLKADPKTLLASAVKAANLGLPVEPALGLAYILPYHDRRTNSDQAQFQIGYKGLIQLAQRSGQVTDIRDGAMRASQFVSWDPIVKNGLKYDKDVPESGPVVGYWAVLDLANGFSHVAYWTREQVEAHRDRFSKAAKYGPWKTDFDAMARKTVLISILKKYAPLSSTQLQQAIVYDAESDPLPQEEAEPAPTQGGDYDQLLGLMRADQVNPAQWFEAHQVTDVASAQARAGELLQAYQGEHAPEPQEPDDYDQYPEEA